VYDGGHGADQPPESFDCLGLPVMSIPRSDAAKMRVARDWVIVTSAGADGVPPGNSMSWFELGFLLRDR
jgi:hypothetical protein